MRRITWLNKHIFPCEDLTTTEPIYNGNDAERRLLIHNDLAVSDLPRQPVPGDSMNVIALAFTEMCCKFGKERVYWLPSAVPIQPTVDHSLWHYCLLPSPVYDPLVWSEDDKQEWLRRRHEGVEFVAYPDELSRRATICILPRAYAGRVGGLQKDGEFQQVQGGLGLMSWSKTDIQHLQRFRFPSGEAVIQRLWEMYFDGKIGAMDLFKDLIISFIGLHSEWVKLRDGSARYG